MAQWDVAPASERHHRDVQGGAARAAVFGVSDGLVSNVALILGVAGADPARSVVRLAGLAGLIAGAVSMAVGEYNSMKVQRELFENELRRERVELRRNPHVETVELTQIYQSRGLQPDQARELAQVMMSDPDRALEAHAREELGISPDDLGQPVAAAGSSFVAFAAGAVVPLLPWFFIGHGGAILLSLFLAMATSAAVGALIARYTGASPVRIALRQVGFVIAAVVVTSAVGRAVGVTV